MSQIEMFEDTEIKNTTPDHFNLSFTGKASFVVGIEGYNPIEIRINDKDLVLTIMRTILDDCNDITSVEAYDATVGKTFKDMLSF